jgi:hypothetical protein
MVTCLVYGSVHYYSFPTYISTKYLVENRHHLCSKDTIGMKTSLIVLQEPALELTEKNDNF